MGEFTGERLIQAGINMMYIAIIAFTVILTGIALDIQNAWFPLGVMIMVSLSLCVNVRWGLNG